jgi:hypothetical protein
VPQAHDSLKGLVLDLKLSQQRLKLEYSNSRSATAQSFNRAIAHESKAKAIYPDLTDDLKIEFRSLWKVERSFQFTSEQVETKVSFSKRAGETGVT